MSHRWTATREGKEHHLFVDGTRRAIVSWFGGFVERPDEWTIHIAGQDADRAGDLGVAKARVEEALGLREPEPPWLIGVEIPGFGQGVVLNGRKPDVDRLLAFVAMATKAALPDKSEDKA